MQSSAFLKNILYDEYYHDHDSEGISCENSYSELAIERAVIHYGWTTNSKWSEQVLVQWKKKKLFLRIPALLLTLTLEIAFK